ncbi:hypothetical protein MTBPR1_60098 [Candidatus Terasakiella magnetica]|uniref:Uncharacterized protein n=1 Tax=Candidatus Terasakiella magnetica TaxID=1867952 RepID=A0A1C3RJZ3_9PROT|nr:hypothetical protein [Candidatus Terasakiella magnetica]SCA57585.1 hypothetical protein MTBPR1_60098 [Candidatus Terasakiella magnetica]
MVKENRNSSAEILDQASTVQSVVQQVTSLKTTGAGAGLGAAHHAGMVSAGGGFFTGKACGLKLGLGLSGFGGPIVLAAVAGLAGYGLFKTLKKK